MHFDIFEIRNIIQVRNFFETSDPRILFLNYAFQILILPSEKRKIAAILQSAK